MSSQKASALSSSETQIESIYRVQEKSVRKIPRAFQASKTITLSRGALFREIAVQILKNENLLAMNFIS